MRRNRRFKALQVLCLPMLLFFLSACSRSLDTTLHFIDPMVMNYKSEASSCSLIESIGETKITEDMIIDDSIQIENFIVKCSSIDTTKTGQVEVIFTTNEASNRETRKSVIIRDIEAPQIVLEKERFEMYVDEFDEMEFFEKLLKVTDNGDELPQVSLKGDVLIKKAGTYNLSVTAVDKANNESSKSLVIVLNEREVAVAPEPEAPSSPVNEGDTEKQPNTNAPSSPPSQPAPHPPSAPSPEPKPKPSNKKYMFGDTDPGTGEVYNMGNVSGYCQSDLFSSGHQGSCTPIQSGGAYVGMELIFY